MHSMILQNNTTFVLVCIPKVFTLYSPSPSLGAYHFVVVPSCTKEIKKRIVRIFKKSTQREGAKRDVVLLEIPNNMSF